jgi:diguanylate cyclase (GGDEF)-like protein
MLAGMFCVCLIPSCTAETSKASPQPLKTVTAIHQLNNAEADRALPVDFEATVTYYRPGNRDLFMQDEDAGVFVHSPLRLNLVPGDRVRVQGTTHGSFRPYVESRNVTLLGHGALPKPIHASFAEMIRGATDCRLVTVRARIRSADLVPGSNSLEPATYLQMTVDGEPVDANVDSGDEKPVQGLLDAEVEISGAVSGHFDNKMQLTGILFHVQSLADVKILKQAHTDPWSLPVTSMDSVMTGFRVRDLGERMRIHGIITYYQPGSALVLQAGSKSLWIATQTYQPLKTGDVADAIGFPDVQNGFLNLTHSEIRDTGQEAAIVPALFSWRDLALGGNKGRSHIFDLVSIEGKVVAEVRQATQDEYVLETGGHLFSAILRHPRTTSEAPLLPMKQVPEGSAVRVIGVCMLSDSNPFNGDVPFNILMRSADDIVVIARPSMLNVGNLIKIVSLLLIVVAASSTWVWQLRRKVRRQTAELATRIEAEAILERKRSGILEDINAARPLDEILLEITELVAFRLSGAQCWCEVGDGLKYGDSPETVNDLNVMCQEILSRSGPLHGMLFAAIDPEAPSSIHAKEALSMGAWLATLAIETCGLYSDLVHRSEFDLLTDLYNRFSLERRLSALIEDARRKSASFGLIYVDLDDFKQVNDQFGHQVGDQYLQEAASRMKRQLRPTDLAARIGGDEFAVLLPNVHTHGEVEEVALRLERCFDPQFKLDSHVLQGSASLGTAFFPEDGATKDSLLSAADAAMYVNKKIKKESGQSVHRR